MCFYKEHTLSIMCLSMVSDLSATRAQFKLKVNGILGCCKENESIEPIHTFLKLRHSTQFLSKALVKNSMSSLIFSLLSITQYHCVYGNICYCAFLCMFFNLKFQKKVLQCLKKKIPIPKVSGFFHTSEPHLSMD